MALSKDEDVGQMRRRRGTSTKRITKEKHLLGKRVLVASGREGWMNDRGRLDREG